MITQWFDPEGGSAVIPGYIARSLQRRGIGVEVLTGFPNYPHGRIYPGYRQRRYQREVIDGITVHRVPLYPNHGARALGRVASYASFAASSTLSLGLLKECDALLAYSTPVTVGLGPAIRGRWSSRPILTVVQDLWPETISNSGMTGSASGGLSLSMARWGSDALYRSSDALAVIAPSMRAALVKRGIPEDRIHVVYNWVDETLFSLPRDGGRLRREWGLEERFIAMYAGNLGEPQNAAMLVDVAQHLRKDAGIVIAVVGDGTLETTMRSRAADLDLDNIVFLGRYPVDQMPSVMAASDVQLVTLAPTPLFDMTIPSKIQFALGFARPIVAAVGGDPARVLYESGAASVVPPGDAASMADGVRRVAGSSMADREELSRRARDFYSTHLSEAIGAGALVDILLDLAGAAPTRGAILGDR